MIAPYMNFYTDAALFLFPMNDISIPNILVILGLVDVFHQVCCEP